MYSIKNDKKLIGAHDIPELIDKVFQNKENESKGLDLVIKILKNKNITSKFFSKEKNEITRLLGYFNIISTSKVM